MTAGGIILTVAMFIYVMVAAVYIIMENRSPQSTFAWLFLFITLPIIGFIVYIFFGHGWRAFSQENKIARHELGNEFMQDLGDLLRRQREYVERIAKEKPASARQKLLRLTNKNSSSILTGYNDVEILQDARQKYPRLLADIKAAQHSIHLNYYIWTEDAFTLQIKDALIERAQAGVEVRCLYDTSGGTMSRQYLQDLTDNGVEIHPYLDYRYLTTLHTINYRSHRKIAVIDGKIGYVGGLNLDVEQIETPAFDTWRDTHLRLVGEAAWALQASFVISWFNTTGQKVTGRPYYAPVETKNFLPVQITQGGPDSQWKAIRQIYFLMIMSAENKIYLQSPFFVPDESILEALKAAALAGIDVRLMFTPRGSTYQIPYRAAHTYFQEVVEAGAKVYLYQAGYFHPKTLNIDNAVVSIGTANMDIRSFALNYETVAIVYDEGRAKQLEAQFLEDMKHCTEWTLEAYEKTPPFRRFVDSIYRLASPIL
ncbi:MAG TPA: cardiolipin synthase [Anaerolineae bacterium]|nr:cardiolipin synthase [Anaerolineae bacterium]MCB9108598.1 cardiolipin synthase [Anaerolineales bacterium]HRV91499.1 cardiolipin synthase [Anaerolineae bacterium]HRV91504.1 cardiolipin synthase [Anaerolineae bacterium]